MSRKIRLYLKNFFENLQNKQVHYLFNVMRCKDGDEIRIFNETDGEWSAKLSQKRVVLIKQLRELTVSENYKIVLCFSPVKRYSDLIVEKATELNIAGIVPTLMSRSVLKTVNIERYSKIIIEATEQCNRLSLPFLSDMVSLFELEQIIRRTFCFKNPLFLICDLHSRAFDWSDNRLFDYDVICIVIGPEGGFSSDDYLALDTFKSKIYLNLSENTLKSETACIAAIQHINCAFAQSKV